MPKPHGSKLTLPEAVYALAMAIDRYTDSQQEVAKHADEAESFKASYERETPGARELHDFLTGEKASPDFRRALRQPLGGGKKAPRTKAGGHGGGA